MATEKASPAAEPITDPKVLAARTRQKERAYTAVVLLETMQQLAEQLSTEAHSERLSTFSESVIKKCKAEQKVQLRLYDLLK